MRNLKLLQLVAQNPAKEKTIRVETQGDEASIYLYDVIDPYWGVGASAFTAALNGITAPTIHLRINSPGGDVFDARAMKTAIEQHKSKVVAHIDGLAASAASFIMLGADEIEASKGAFVMIHNAWAYTMGNADELRNTAEILDKVDDQIMRDYVGKTGSTQRQVKQWMADETWFTADEALQNGFIDRLYEADQAKAEVFNLAAYKNAPKAYGSKPELRIDDAAAQMRAAAERRLTLDERTAA